MGQDTDATLWGTWKIIAGVRGFNAKTTFKQVFINTQPHSCSYGSLFE